MRYLAILLLLGCTNPIAIEEPPCVTTITITDHMIAGQVINPIGPDLKSKFELRTGQGFKCSKIAEGIVWIPWGNFVISADYLTYSCTKGC